MTAMRSMDISLPAYPLREPVTPLIDACLQGKAAPSNFEDYVQYWHTYDTGDSLCAILGMSDRAYSLMMKHGGVNIIGEALACRRLGADFDQVWTPDKEPALLKWCREIDAAKAELHDQRHLTNAATYQKLAELGELIAGKNEISGLKQDIEYLYSDDGEFSRCVAGFIGDESPLVDANGQRLLVGDSVCYPDTNWERMVIFGMDGSPMLHQEDLLKRGAVKSCSCWELNMETACCAVFTVTHESCLKDYKLYQNHQMGLPPWWGGMTLG